MTRSSKVLILAVCSLILNAPAGLTKASKMTIEDRQDQLMSNINQSQQNNELTVKEAKKLRSDLADVAHKKAKIKGKKTKLDAEDQQKLESDLNDISVEINQKKLDKRLHPEEHAKEQQKALEEKKAASEGKAKARLEEVEKAREKAAKAKSKTSSK